MSTKHKQISRFCAPETHVSIYFFCLKISAEYFVKGTTKFHVRSNNCREKYLQILNYYILKISTYFTLIYISFSKN